MSGAFNSKIRRTLFSDQIGNSRSQAKKKVVHICSQAIMVVHSCS